MMGSCICVCTHHVQAQEILARHRQIYLMTDQQLEAEARALLGRDSRTSRLLFPSKPGFCIILCVCGRLAGHSLCLCMGGWEEEHPHWEREGGEKPGRATGWAVHGISGTHFGSPAWLRDCAWNKCMESCTWNNNCAWNHNCAWNNDCNWNKCME